MSPKAYKLLMLASVATPDDYYLLQMIAALIIGESA